MARALSLYRYPTAAHPFSHTSLRRSMRDFDRLFAGLGRSLFDESTAPTGEKTFSPRVDVSEDDAAYRLVAELPGVEADGFSVTVEEDVVVLSGERVWPAADAEAEPKSSSFERRFRFYQDIDADGVKAVYRNGLLTVTVPKRAEPEPINVEIQSA